MTLSDAMKKISVLKREVIATRNRLVRERDALIASSERAVDEFNAGHDAALAHVGPMPDNPREHEPVGVVEDEWGCGWAWGAYAKLIAEREALRGRVVALQHELFNSRNDLEEVARLADTLATPSKPPLGAGDGPTRGTGDTQMGGGASVDE